MSAPWQHARGCNTSAVIAMCLQRMSSYCRQPAASWQFRGLAPSWQLRGLAPSGASLLASVHTQLHNHGHAIVDMNIFRVGT